MILSLKKDGAIYFTDDTGGLRLRDQDPRRGIAFSGVFRWKDGKTTAVIRDIPHANGLAFSPDEKILYANGSREPFVRAYDVQADAHQQPACDRPQQRSAARHHRWHEGRYQGEYLGVRTRRHLDYFAAGRGSRSYPGAGTGRQFGVRRSGL